MRYLQFVMMLTVKERLHWLLWSLLVCVLLLSLHCAPICPAVYEKAGETLAIKVYDAQREMRSLLNRREVFSTSFVHTQFVETA